MMEFIKLIFTLIPAYIGVTVLHIVAVFGWLATVAVCLSSDWSMN